MESPIEVVRRFCAAWSADMGADDLAAFFTDDAVYHNIPLPPVTGRENIAENIASYIRPGPPGIEGIEFRIINIAADGPVVMTERFDVFKLPDTSFGIPVMGTFEVRDGEINAWRDYFDMNQFISQMGDHPLQVERRGEAWCRIERRSQRRWRGARPSVGPGGLAARPNRRRILDTQGVCTAQRCGSPETQPREARWPAAHISTRS